MINNLGSKIKTGIKKLGNKMYDNKWKILAGAGALGLGALGLGMKYGLGQTPNDVKFYDKTNPNFVTPDILAQIPHPHQSRDDLTKRYAALGPIKNHDLPINAFVPKPPAFTLPYIPPSGY